MIDLAITFYAAKPLWLQSLIGLALLAVAALAINFLLKKVILRLAARFLDTRSRTADKAAARLATVVPLALISRGIALVPNLPPDVETIVINGARAAIVLAIAMAVSKTLDYAEEVYQRYPQAKTRPIKGYIQVVKILIYGAAVILGIAVLIEESPVLLLSGLGALAAVIMLVFKDTLLSLVASVQLTSDDMLRVGDWIEVPDLGANGDVIDIALHTVKVQNFDKTITTIPTYRLISESFLNWRGMREAGGRRIKRALPIDQNSVRFLSAEEVAQLRRFRLLGPFLEKKDAELREWNARELAGDTNPVNARRFTNIGIFRAYVVAYLKAHKRLTAKQTLMVRQLDPSPQGLPLEIYCFTGTTNWLDYEGIQSDIFDHLLAILPEFDLRLFQEPSGMDVRGLVKG